MKKTLKILILFVAVAVIVLSRFIFDSSDQLDLDAENWTTYSNTEYGFSVKYPCNLQNSCITQEEDSFTKMGNLRYKPNNYFVDESGEFVLKVVSGSHVECNEERFIDGKYRYEELGGDMFIIGEMRVDPEVPDRGENQALCRTGSYLIDVFAFADTTPSLAQKIIDTFHLNEKK